MLDAEVEAHWKKHRETIREILAAVRSKQWDHDEGCQQVVILQAMVWMMMDQTNGDLDKAWFTFSKLLLNGRVWPITTSIYQNEKEGLV